MGNLSDLIKVHISAAWRRRWWTLGTVWATSVLGWVILAYLPNQFESSARLYVDSDAILVPLLRGIAVDTGSVNQTDLMQKTLLSPSNLDRLIALTPLHLRITTDEERENLNRRLSQQIHISSRERNLFAVTYRDVDPVLARDIVQAALSILLENQAETSQVGMMNAQRFLREQIASYEQQLTEAENRRAEFRAKYFDLLPGAANTASRLQIARSSLATAEGELADNKTKLAALNQQLKTIPGLLTVDGGSAMVVRAGPLAGPSPSEQRLAEARHNLDSLLTRLTEAHPDVIAARRLFARLHAEAAKTPATGSRAPDGSPAHSISNPVYEQVRLRVVDMEISIASLERRIASGTAEVNRLEQLSREAPGVEAEFERLDRDYNILKKNHDELVSRIESAKIAAAADSTSDAKVRLIEPPRIAQVPIAPNRHLLILAVFALAMGAGGGVLFLLHWMDASFPTIHALRQIGLPVLGSISLTETPGRQRSRMGTVGFAAAAATLFVSYGGLMLAASKLRWMI